MRTAHRLLLTLLLVPALFACSGSTDTPEETTTVPVENPGLPPALPNGIPLPRDAKLLSTEAFGDPVEYEALFELDGQAVSVCIDLFDAYEAAGYRLREPLPEGAAATVAHTYDNGDWTVTLSCGLPGDESAEPGTLRLNAVPRPVSYLRPRTFATGGPGPAVPATEIPDAFPKDVPLPTELVLSALATKTEDSPWALSFRLGDGGLPACQRIFSLYSSAGFRQDDAYDDTGLLTRVFANDAHVLHIDCFPYGPQSDPSLGGGVTVAVYGPMS